MKRNNFGYFIREGVRDLFVHGLMSFASICIIIACLVIMGSFTLLILNINSMIADLEQENEILVYIDESLTDAEARSVGSNINMIENVYYARFVSSEEAMQSFVAQYEDESIFAGVDASVLRNRYSIVLVDITKMAETKSQLEQIEGVAQVNAHLEISEGFLTIRTVVGLVSAVIIAVLFVVSVFIISNTVRLALFGRREEISIMKMVGATNWFIRWPFIVEGMLLGLIGATLAFFIVWGGYYMIVGRIALADTISIISLIPFDEVLWPMVIVFAGVGFLVGVGGSLTSIRKFLKV